MESLALSDLLLLLRQESLFFFDLLISLLLLPLVLLQEYRELNHAFLDDQILLTERFLLLSELKLSPKQSDSYNLSF